MSAGTQTILSTYIAAISKAHATGKATEHSYRPAIKALVEGLAVKDSEAFTPGTGNNPRDVLAASRTSSSCLMVVSVGGIETATTFSHAKSAPSLVYSQEALPQADMNTWKNAPDGAFLHHAVHISISFEMVHREMSGSIS